MSRSIPFIVIGIIIGLIVGVLVTPYTGLTPTRTVTSTTTLVSTVQMYTTYTQIKTVPQTITEVVPRTITTSIEMPYTTTVTYTQTQTVTVTSTQTMILPVEVPVPKDVVQQRLFEFVLPWNDNITSSIDLSAYLHKPAGKYGHVYVGSDGRLYVGNQRIRFLGTNLVASSAFPLPSTTDQLVQRLAKYGINLVRIHSLDANWGTNIFRRVGSLEFNPIYLDRFDYLIYKLKENGIYIDINLVCYWDLRSDLGLPKEIDTMRIEDKHVLAFFYEPVRNLFKEFAKQLLDRVNKYTGLRYADDPAIAFIEILNENGMVAGWLNGAVDRLPEVFRVELQKKWNEYLRLKYKSTENLRKEWGDLGLLADENIEEGKVRVFTLTAYSMRTPKAQRDWVEFLWRLEYDFFMDMYRFLKKEIGVKALVIASQIAFGGGMPNVVYNLDVVDAHGYWQYSTSAMPNIAMVNNPPESTVVALANRRIYGKPFTVSEYNHQFPNMYRAEAIVFLPAYAAFHDWDAIMFYCYGDPGGSPVFDTKAIRSSLDIDQDPARWALMITAYMLFVRGDVQPARYWVAAELPKETEVDITARRAGGDVGRWNLPNGLHLGIPREIALIHGLGLVVSNATKPPYAISPRDVQIPKDKVYVSDTGELIWDCREAGRCIFIVNTSRSKVISGFIGGKRIDLGDIVIDVRDTLLDGWATIALHVLEGSSFRDAKKILVIAVGAAFNSDMPIYEYISPTQSQLLFIVNTSTTSIPNIYGKRLLIQRGAGRPPTIVEGVNAIIMIKTDRDLVARSLNEVGLPKEKIPVASAYGYKIMFIGSVYRTMWYEINIS